MYAKRTQLIVKINYTYILSYCAVCLNAYRIQWFLNENLIQFNRVITRKKIFNVILIAKVFQQIRNKELLLLTTCVSKRYVFYFQSREQKNMD